MDIAKSSRRLTQVFFEETKKFVDTSGLDYDRKIELYESLRSDLRSNKNSISLKSFADENFSGALRDEYVSYMKAKSFPTSLVAKDTEYVAAKIRQKRRMNFSSEIQILGAAGSAEPAGSDH